MEKDCTHNGSWREASTWPTRTEGLFTRVINGMEILASSWPLFGRGYESLFYGKMIRQELAVSGITPGMRVMHVGCGAFPVSAIHLARFGLRVTAADVSEATLNRAQKAVRRSGTQDRIQLLRGCGTRLDFSAYDAVWLSFHVRPMQGVLHRAMQMLSPGSVLVFRDPRDLLSGYYPEADRSFPQHFRCRRINQILGKKSVILTKDAASAGFLSAERPRPEAAPIERCHAEKDLSAASNR